jgi:hypothetical protein
MPKDYLEYNYALGCIACAFILPLEKGVPAGRGIFEKNQKILRPAKAGHLLFQRRNKYKYKKVKQQFQ